MWDRLRGKKVCFSGKFEYLVRERLTILAREHGATIARDIGPKLDYLVVQTGSGGKTVQQRVKSLNAKGSTIQIIDVDDFATVIAPTEAEVIDVIRRGHKAKQLLNEGINERHSRGAGSPAWVITGQSFAGLNLMGLHLDNGDFVSCDFSRADLSATRFASVTDCKFDKAKGHMLHIEIAQGCSFRGAKLLDSNVEDRARDCDFTGADMSKLRLDQWLWGNKKQKMTGLVFKDAKLVSAIVNDVTLVQPDFSGADLTKSVFCDVTIDAGNFRNAVLVDASLSGSKFQNADFSGANLRKANLVDADLTGATFDGADLAGCNLRGAKTSGVNFAKAKGYSAASQALTSAGAALRDLDKAIAKAKRIKFSIRIAEAIDGDDQIHGDSSHLRYGWAVSAPVELPRTRSSFSKTTMSQELLMAARAVGDVKLRFETLEIQTTKSKTNAKELRDLFTRALCEAFANDVPDSDKLASQIKSARRAMLKATAGARKRRANALARAKALQEKREKREASKMEHKVATAVGGKVSDIASFLKALEVRAEKAKIEKATAMLKAERFQLFNDITDQHLSGVVKSQTDPDLVYACRIESDGKFACCTQNLNICGGLRGSICKHLLVLITGLVKAGQLDPATIDGWVAKTRSTKPELDKDKMGEIFIRYKGAEAGEIDWRPTETTPEDYYAL